MAKKANVQENVGGRVALLFVLIVLTAASLVAIWMAMPRPVEKPERVLPSLLNESTAPHASTSTAASPAKQACDAAGGHWIDCGSPCHGSPPGTACAQVCEPQCLCGGTSVWTCPSNLSCQSKDEQGIGVCRIKPVEPIESTSTVRELPAGAICDDTNSICVNGSYQNTLLASPFSVTGTAIAFENQFSYMLIDGNAQEIQRGTVTAQASSTGTAADFTARDFILSVPKTTTGTLVFYDLSSKDGLPMHILRIKVRLPTEGMTVNTYWPGMLGDFEPQEIVKTKLPLETTVELELRGFHLESAFRVQQITFNNGTVNLYLARTSQDTIAPSDFETILSNTLKQFTYVKKVIISGP